MFDVAKVVPHNPHDKEQKMLQTKMHPSIDELAKALLSITSNPPQQPTQADRDKLMSVRKKIKLLGDGDGVTLAESDETDRQYLYVVATKEANRQEDFYERNGNKWAPPIASKGMFMTLRRDWDALNATGNMCVMAKIPAGRHEIERIPNPLHQNGTFWFVLKGTLIGATEGSWRQWQRNPLATDDDSDFDIVIEE